MKICQRYRVPWSSLSSLCGIMKSIISSWPHCIKICMGSCKTGKAKASLWFWLFLLGLDNKLFICRVISCVVGRGCFGMTSGFSCKTLLDFALLHFVLESQTFLLIQVSLDFLLLHSSPLWWKGHLGGFYFFWCSGRCCKYSQNQSASVFSASVIGA